LSSLITKEWLEADGLGGFASGTVAGIRTRRYHALLLVATNPPTGRMVLVNGFDAWVTTPAGTFALSSQLYTPGVAHPDGARRVAGFKTDPWPKWTFRIDDGTVVEQEILVPKGAAVTVLRWRVATGAPGVTLSLRPFLSGRDYHALHHENPAFRFDAEMSGEYVVWQPYSGVPGVIALSNGSYAHQPDWYRNFQYDEERARGLDGTEDLASPGIFSWNLSSGEAILILAAAGHEGDALRATESTADCANRLRKAEKTRRNFLSPLARAADAYLVQRHAGKTIVAGYPWFTDWGRDTFIALRGICLATGRLEEARDILTQWAGAVSEGMVPNRFPDAGETPEYNAVDASLWFVVAAEELLQAAKRPRRRGTPKEPDVLRAAVTAILEGYYKGTRYGIRCDEDGLLAAGEPRVQLTWMDARVGDWVVTPRIGKPVEVQALWLNALKIGSAFSERWAAVFQKGVDAFRARFWNEAGGYLYDVVDVDHRAGTVDAAFRPNQIFAVGGLPFALLEGERARRVVDAVEARLLTPVGLRSLAPGEPGYAGRYEGGVRERDGVYHQGTVWPWLLGAFVEGWVRVRGNTREAKREARERFLAPLLQHLDEAGLGHISEIADGDPPHTPRGCPFQAWSVGEVLRLDQVVLAE
jgi:predicted glycogen debranching enzyme